MRLRRVAWNGIALSVPGDWELSRMAPRHLAWDTGSRPAMELRWNTIRGKFSFDRTLKRLWRGRARRNSAAMVTWDLPQHWTALMADHRMQGFHWHTPQTAAQGVLLFCTVCSTATLIQIFHASAASAPRRSLWESIFLSFRDHWPDGRGLWQVYDIKARLPVRLGLDRFQFQPGCFQLEFSSKTQRLRLYRWSPAAVLLGSGDLDDFARGQGVLGAGRGTPRYSLRDRRLDWTLAPASRLRLLPWRRASIYEQGRVWHLKGANRILGMVLQGKKEVNPAEFDRWAAEYVLAPA